MTLTTRLLTFFLATLGLVLTGFSAALFLFAQDYLHRQSDARLEAAAHTLVAACEIGPTGVEWEPRERSLAFADGPAGDPLVWLVTDAEGAVVDRSNDPAAEDLLGEAAVRLKSKGRSTGRMDWRGVRWRVHQQTLAAPPHEGPTRPLPPPGETRYPALVVTVGVPFAPVSAALWRLGGVLAGLSAAVWGVALVSGRVVCRRALRPLTRMAEAARAMPADATGSRLPVGPAADEVAGLGRAFNDLLDRLGESHERQRRFTGEASHQLRTPLTAVLGQVEVALRRDRPPEEYRRTLEAVRGQADRMRRLVESLLFLARADSDGGLLERQPIDLAAWLPEHIGTWSVHPRAADLTVRTMTAGAARVEAQSDLLGELMGNLIDNAFKYSRTGTPVRVTLGADGGLVWVEVEDAGSGIRPEAMASLLRPFFRPAETRQLGVPGFGLGLAVADRLAKAFGGGIQVESEVGRGSRFRLNLPAVE